MAAPRLHLGRQPWCNVQPLGGCPCPCNSWPAAAWPVGPPCKCGPGHRGSHLPPCLPNAAVGAGGCCPGPHGRCGAWAQWAWCTLAGGPDFVAGVANGHIVAPMAHSHACWPPCMWPVVGGIARGAAWGNACPPNALPNAAAAPVKWWLCPGWWAAAASTSGSAAAPGWRPQWRQAGGVWLQGGVGVSPHMRPLASSGLRLGCGAPQRCPGTYTWATGPAAHTCGPGRAMCCTLHYWVLAIYLAAPCMLETTQAQILQPWAAAHAWGSHTGWCGAAQGCMAKHKFSCMSRAAGLGLYKPRGGQGAYLARLGLHA